MNAIYEYYKGCLTVKGRLARLEYFQRTLSLIILLMVTAAFVLVLNMGDFGSIAITAIAWSFMFIFFLVGMYSIVANIMLNIRRLHDINLSGWWVLWLFVIEAAVGFILAFLIQDEEISSTISGILSLVIVLGYFLIPGTKGENKYDLAENSVLSSQVEIEKEEILVIEEVKKEIKKKIPSKKVVKKIPTKKKTATKAKPKKTVAKKKTPAKKISVTKNKKTTKTKGTK